MRMNLKILKTGRTIENSLGSFDKNTIIPRDSFVTNKSINRSDTNKKSYIYKNIDFDKINEILNNLIEKTTNYMKWFIFS